MQMGLLDNLKDLLRGVIHFLPLILCLLGEHNMLQQI